MDNNQYSAPLPPLYPTKCMSRKTKGKNAKQNRKRNKKMNIGWKDL
jgi:hypothetical protein